MNEQEEKSTHKELVERTEDKNDKQATGDRYKLPSESKVKEELKEGVE